MLAGLLVVAGACSAAPGAAPARSVVPGPAIVAPSGHRPVLIVPGWALLCENGPPSEWQLWLDEFDRAGYAPGEVEVYQGSRCEPNVRTAERVGELVDDLLARTGEAKVDLIAHSMGALGARWCQKFGACAGKVANVVTLSGANHGTFWAQACALQFWSQACPDMRADSPMLAALNAGDETPDEVHWESYVTICELVILPRASTLLEGAVNHDQTDRCVFHDDWKKDAATARDVVALLAGSPDDPGAATRR